MSHSTPAPIRPASPAGLLDALRYPLHAGALAALLVLLVLRVLASGLPFIAPLLHLLLWLAIYKYALEILAASAVGRREPPDVLSQLDDSTHRRHVWVQLLVLFLLALGMQLEGPLRLLLIGACALVMPGVILALAIAQNLLAAWHPGNWWRLAAELGVGYGLLSIAWALLLGFQVYAADLAGLFPKLPALLFYYALSHYFVLVLFRWMGLFLHSYGARLGFATQSQRMPTLQRDREQQALQQDHLAAREIKDPAARAAALSPLIRAGAAAEVHRDYRNALRAAGRYAELIEHARIRCGELIVTQHSREALALARESLAEQDHFTLHQGGELEQLIAAAERVEQWRMAVDLALNYRRQFARRRDSLTIVARAAAILADRLHDPEQAAHWLDGALADSAGTEHADQLQRLRTRLAAKQPLMSGL